MQLFLIESAQSGSLTVDQDHLWCWMKEGTRHEPTVLLFPRVLLRLFDTAKHFESIQRLAEGIAACNCYNMEGIKAAGRTHFDLFIHLDLGRNVRRYELVEDNYCVFKAWN